MMVSMTWGQAILVAICIALIICPPRFDPAIWLQERNERKRAKK